MIDKFKKSSSERLIKWINLAVSILNDRGIDVRVKVHM